MKTQLHRRLLKSRFTGFALAAATAPLFIHSAYAVAITWDNGGGDKLWSNSANWSDGVGDIAASGNDLTFNATGVAATGTATNIVDVNTSVNSLAFTNTGTSATAHTTQINSGVTLTISGAVANALTSASTAQATNVFTGAGSLVVGSGNTATTWTANAGTNGAANISTFDMSGLANFTFNGGVVSLGTGPRNAVTASLATTSSITATSVTLGGNITTGGALTTLNLGQTNTIKANTISVGGGRSAGALQFLSSLTGPTLTITDTAGTGGANLNIATLATNASGLGSGTVDFSLGTVAATLGTVSLGTSANGTATGSATGTLTFGAGTLTATAMNVGNGSTGTITTATGTGIVNMTASAGTLTATTVTLGKLSTGSRNNAATGTFNQNGGTAVITNLRLADATGNSGTGGGIINATYNLAAGTLKLGTIAAGTAGTGSGVYAYNRTFNWTGGTIQNLNASTSATISGVAITTTGSGNQTFLVDAGRSITVSSNITGTGGFIKTGDGTLILSGASNNYAGGTVVNDGTVSYTTAFTMAGSNEFGLNGSASPVLGTDFGRITASASFGYGGTLNFNFTGVAVSGASYDLFDVGASSGDFTSVSIGGSYASTPFAETSVGSKVWELSTGGVKFIFTADGGINDGILAISAIPEPSSFALMAGVAGLGLAGLRRRRRA